MLFALKMTYLIMASTWRVLARFADIRQAVLRGLAKLADIRLSVLRRLARLADICQGPFLRKM
jgi:hypothetical protein